MGEERKLTAVFEVSPEPGVPFQLLMDALSKFKSILNTASADVLKKQAKQKSEWLVSSLNYSSPVTIIARPFLEPEAEQFRGQIFEQVQKLYSAKWVTPSNDGQRMVDSLRTMRNGTITNMYLVDSATGVMTTLPPMPTKEHPKPPALIPTHPIQGSVIGRAQVLQSRKDLLFWLFDVKTDDPVLCYVEQDQREWLEGLLDKVVEVYGAITRDPVSGKPKIVQGISRIDEIEPLAAGAQQSLSGYLEGKLRTRNGTR